MSSDDKFIGDYIVEQFQQSSHNNAAKIAELWANCGYTIPAFRKSIIDKIGPDSKKILPLLESFQHAYAEARAAKGSVNTSSASTQSASKGISNSGKVATGNSNKSSTSGSLTKSTSSTSLANSVSLSQSSAASSIVSVAAMIGGPPPQAPQAAPAPTPAPPKVIEDPIFADLEKIETFSESLTLFPVLPPDEVNHESAYADDLLLKTIRRSGPKIEPNKKEIDWKSDNILDASIMTDVLKMNNISYGSDIGSEALSYLSSSIQTYLSVVLNQSIEKNRIRRSLSMKSKYENVCKRIKSDPGGAISEDDVKKLILTKFGPDVSDILSIEESKSRALMIANLHSLEEKFASELQSESKRMKFASESDSSGESMGVKSLEGILYGRIQSAVVDNMAGRSWGGQGDVNNNSNNNDNDNDDSNNSSNANNNNSSSSSHRTDISQFDPFTSHINNGTNINDTNSNAVELAYSDVSLAISSLTKYHPHVGGPLGLRQGYALQRSQLCLPIHSGGSNISSN